MTIRRVLQPEQWQMLDRLQSVGCPVDYDHLLTPLHVFAESWIVQNPPESGGSGFALRVRIVASTSITIRRFRLRTNWHHNEMSWLEFCNQHGDNSQKYYCFRAHSRGDFDFSSENVLNHRTLHRGVLKRGGFLRGFLLGTFDCESPPTRIGTKLQATLSIEDLFENEYRFPLVLRDHTSESNWEDWMLQQASAKQATVMPLTGNEDEPM